MTILEWCWDIVKAIGILVAVMVGGQLVVGGIILVIAYWLEWYSRNW